MSEQASGAPGPGTADKESVPGATGPRLRLSAWLKRGATAACALLALLALGWSNYYLRHKMLRLVTVIESALTPGGSSEGTASAEAGAVPLYLHAAKPDRGCLPNSMLSVEAAARRYRRIELDLVFSSDDVPFLGHGNELAAITTGSLEDPERRTAAELDEIGLKDGSKLARFARFAECHAGRFDHIILDVKTSHSGAEAKARALAGIIGPGEGGRYLVVSLSGVFLSWFKQARPEVPVGCESYLATANWLAGFDAISLPLARVNESHDRRARRLGLKRFYWTAWHEDHLRRLLSWKPEGVIVDLAGENPPRIPDQWLKTEPRD